MARWDAFVSSRRGSPSDWIEAMDRDDQRIIYYRPPPAPPGSDLAVLHRAHRHLAAHSAATDRGIQPVAYREMVAYLDEQGVGGDLRRVALHYLPAMDAVRRDVLNVASSADYWRPDSGRPHPEQQLEEWLDESGTWLQSPWRPDPDALTLSRLEGAVEAQGASRGG